MNTKEAKELMLKYLIPQIERYGFKPPGKGSEFEIKRKVKSGEDVIVGGFTDYNPIQKIIFSFSKRHKSIIDILKVLEVKGVKLSPPISKHTGTIGSSYRLLHDLNTSEYLPEMQTEADVEKCVNLMLEFLEGTAFPLLDKFEDLREIDKIINGNEPWITDVGQSYTFGAYFNFSRLIIAKLCGNPRYDALIELTYSKLERISAESGNSFHGRDDLSKPIPALIKILKDVEPIY
ncbi:MAG: hypothetical protein E6Q24_14300 [Chitinophagaceae bacterium]|jgi:hypothetical protein|nr:MAG: hypothetical protein E6Q24_14300 [Chitinophagaceae bacterium]